MNQPERELKIECRKLSRSLGLVIWDNASGVSVGEKSVVSYGLCRGSSDLIGVLAPSGIFVAIEIKTASGLRDHIRAFRRHAEAAAQQRPVTMDERRAFEQRLFVELVIRQGGIAGFATSVDEFKGLIERTVSHEEIIGRYRSTRRTSVEPGYAV